jgi:hypothetical protein
MKTLSALVILILATASLAAEPLYIDEMMETPASELRRAFRDLRTEGCYRIGEQQFLLISIDKKDQKPWRVVLSSVEPCRRPVDVAALEVRARSGIRTGDSAMIVLEELGRPDTSAAPERALRPLGETEYFYLCRVEEGCARHTSVFFNNGIVTAIAEWYSE